jgi:hypothetical protein
VRVRDVVAELRTFPANIAYMCHDFAPNPSRFRAAGFCRPLQAPPSSLKPMRSIRASLPGRPSGRIETCYPASLSNLQYTRNRPPKPNLALRNSTRAV